MATATRPPALNTLPPLHLDVDRFWINNQSRMYLLEGTADLQHHYHLKMGDVLIFAQKDDKTIVLAGRPSTRADAARKAAARKPSPTPVGVKSGGKASKDVSAGAVLGEGVFWGTAVPC